MNKLGLIVLLCISLFSISLFSQDKPKNNWYFFGSLGYQNLEIDNLNKILTDNNFPSLSNSLISMDLTVIYKRGKHNFSGEISISSPWDSKINNMNNESMLSSRGYILSYGYDIVSNQRLFIFPFIGFSSNIGSLKLSNSKIESTDFGTTLLSFNNQNSYSVSTPSFVIGLQGNYNICKRLVMGLKLGYNFSPTSTTVWMMENGNTLSNGPNVSLGGFYSRISIGYKIRN
jgi:hypothetical protein